MASTAKRMAPKTSRSDFYEVFRLGRSHGAELPDVQPTVMADRPDTSADHHVELIASFQDLATPWERGFCSSLTSSSTQGSTRWNRMPYTKPALFPDESRKG